MRAGEEANQMKIKNILSLLPVLSAAMFNAGAAPLTLDSEFSLASFQTSEIGSLAPVGVARTASSQKLGPFPGSFEFLRNGLILKSDNPNPWLVWSSLDSVDADPIGALTEPQPPVLAASAPEPATMLLIGCGLFGIAMVFRRVGAASKS